MYKYCTIFYKGLEHLQILVFGMGTGESVLNHFSHVWLFATLWTVAHQAPLSMGFSRQEYWSGLPCLLQGLPDPGIDLCLLHWQAGSLPLVPPGKQCFSAICIFNLFNEYLRSKYQSLTDFTSEKVAFWLIYRTTLSFKWKSIHQSYIFISAKSLLAFICHPIIF